MKIVTVKQGISLKRSLTIKNLRFTGILRYFFPVRKNLHIITGASKGLGLEIAQFLANNGDQVISLSRSQTPPHLLIRNMEIDLSAEFSAKEIFSSILDEFPLEKFHQISLVNNAGMIDPISPAARLRADQTLKNIALNLTAPILLTNQFLQKTKDYQGNRVIFNVSSGVARRPKASWSVYSAAKAGLEAYSLAIQKELNGPKFKVVIFDPGVMDTNMQSLIRKSSEEDFPELKRFIGFKENGELLDPSRVGKIAAQVVLGEIAPDKAIVSIEELISVGH